MAIKTGAIKAGGSEVYPHTALDQIRKSATSSTTLIASGGVIKKDFLDLTGLISSSYVSSANVIPTSAINGLSTAIINEASSYVNSSSVVPVSAIIDFNSAVSSAIGSSIQPGISAGFGINITGGSTISLARTRPITTIPSTSTSVTLQPGEAYIIDATTTSKTLNVGSVPSGHFGLESHMEIFVANTGYIVTGTNVVLTQPLEPDSVNNCTIRFHDGFAIISVEDHVAGYIVVSSGSASNTSGTLAYGLTSASSNYIGFDGRLNGSAIPFGGVTANGKKSVVGNGYDNTILTGDINCGASKFTVANLSLQNITVNGGTLTLGDVYIPSGSTVAVSGGGLAIERATGDGGLIALGGKQILANQTRVTGVTVSGGSNNVSAFAGAILVTNTTCELESCTLVGNNCSNAGGAVAALAYGRVLVSTCIISGNSSVSDGGGIYCVNAGASATVVSSYITANSTGTVGGTKRGGGVFVANNAATVDLVGTTVTGNFAGVGKDVYALNTGVINASNCTLGDCYTSAGSYTFAGSNVLEKLTGVNGKVIISSSAILDLTGDTNATPIAPVGGIVMGSNVQIYPSAGSASAIDISGGTYTALTNGGVLMGPMYATNGETLSGNATIDLQKTILTVASRTTVNVSGLTFLNGSGVAGALNVSGYASATIVNCNFVSCGGTNAARGILFWNYNGAIVSGCSFSGGYGGTGRAGYIYVQNTSAYITSCTFSGGYAVLPDRGAKVFLEGNVLTNLTVCSNNSITFTGSNWLKGKLDPMNTKTSGNVYITDGAIVDLTSNANAIPIYPRGVITIPAGAVVSIIGSNGITSAYLSELALTGTTITNVPSVLGATVTVPATGGPWEIGFADNTTSTYSATGTARQVVLTGAVTYIGAQ